MSTRRKKKLPLSVQFIEKRKPPKTWIFLMQGSKAKVFEHDGGNELVALRALVNPGGRSRVRELVTDRGGNPSKVPVGGGRHAALPSENAQEHAVTVFARNLAADIEAGIAKRSCDRVVLAAEPHCLGKVKGSLSAQALKQVRALIQKDLFKLSERELYSELKSVLR